MVWRYNIFLAARLVPTLSGLRPARRGAMAAGEKYYISTPKLNLYYTTLCKYFLNSSDNSGSRNAKSTLARK
jgi:hypothetical protein